MAKEKTSIKDKDQSPPKTREEALAQALKEIEKAHGQGAIMRLGDTANRLAIDVIPTGILPLDLALGVGGLPRGRIVEIYGPESSGKTTVTLHMIAEAQRRGGIAAFIDAEHALDPIYAKKLGVDIDNLLVSQPDNGEQALDITESLVQSSAVDIIVVDSVAALVPKQEIEGDMGGFQVGLQARLMSQAMRKLTGTIGKTKTVVVFINQIREKVGVMYGNPEVTTGGRALKFFSSVRIDIRKTGEAIQVKSTPIGYHAKAKVVKNKVAPPFKVATFDVMFGEGVSREGSILDIATTLEIVQKSGSWYSYGGNRLGQGRDAVRDLLKQRPDLYAEFEAQIREKMDEAVKTVAEDFSEDSNANSESSTVPAEE